MSNLENVELEEKAWEAFVEGLDTEYDLRNKLALQFLEDIEYYMYCKDDAYHYLTDRLDDIFEILIKWDWEETVRNPVEAARRYLSA